MATGNTRILTGWGRTRPGMSSRLELPANSDWPAMLKALSASGVISRGLGRSYNDAAQLSGGSFIDTTVWNHVLHFDASTGVLLVEAGASLDQLMREFSEAGFFMPVTPGTRHITIGGAIACDVHGKNHHRDGSFTDHVLSIELATPSGTLNLSRTENSELFFATCGGMGLTGIILNAAIRLIPIESSYMKVDTQRAKNIDEVMSLMEADDYKYQYSVAWLDSMARGTSLGRAVLTRADHAKLEDLSDRQLTTPLEFKPSTLLSAPDIFPSGIMNTLTTRAFNELWYLKAPRRQMGTIQHATSFFHPLDGVDNWNRIYGPRGFVQYQFAVPLSGEETVKNSLELLVRHKAGSFLTVLKRFGRSNDGLMSFPLEGWTLALDLPVGSASLPGLFDRLDEMVISAGGRVYLAKDARVSKTNLKLMYPQFDHFREVVNSVNPSRIIRSDLSKRLGI